MKGWELRRGSGLEGNVLGILRLKGGCENGYRKKIIALVAFRDGLDVSETEIRFVVIKRYTGILSDIFSPSALRYIV